ncbi:beta-propeller fold lactonase family protein [Tautonia plasticadhaerens]|uniref:Lactonase, 7-bladed beta-propeller n=1 Tax=Tautonia plasticadhaerens TaxID=2527974 RepID=A0A518H035_9BACT|nr:beta-propeller fold lactonase family protein [Tautonia plasticadhaerens]QDV34193.1 Lactonase, 7-bladed beta-propeller [Tautonia plasticadhaerens]
MTVTHHPAARMALILGLALPIALALRPTIGDESGASPPDESGPHRSPVALALSGDGSRLLTANETSGTVSLVDPGAGLVVDEIPTGERPVGVAISGDGARGAVVHWYGYDLAVLKIGQDGLEVADRVEVGPEPRGVAMTPDGSTAYVAVGVSNEVVRVDLDRAEVTGRVAVGREPRGLALSPSGDRLMVGNNRSGSVTVVRTGDLTVERTVAVRGSNLRQVAIDPEGEFAYVANMENRGMATTDRNIDLGWVLGQRLTRIPLEGSEEDYATQSLDPQGEAVGDVHGVAVSGDGRFIAVSAGGTHEVILFRTDLKRLPWRTGGSRDLIHFSLRADDGRFRRVVTGGRPTELAFAPDGTTLYATNYLDDSVQVIDAETAELVRSIDLGGPEEPSLARRGEMLFHDAGRSHNQWYSCNTCHSEGHLNGERFDTMNDGWHEFSNIPTDVSKKDVPSLRGVTRTGPWTWHGWQSSIEDAMIESFTKSMQGDPPTAEEVEAIIAYLGTLERPRNPYVGPDGAISEAAERGRAVFNSPKAACNTCHSGPEFTDGEIHVVGLEGRRDVYEGYNPPTLRGLYDSDPYLHDGRADSLREALTGDHAPDFVSGLGELTEQETADLVEYLKTL